MRRRGRVRRVGKWAGVAVCVILLAGQVVGRFGFVGGLGTAIYYLSLWLLVEKIHIGIMLATSISFILVVIENYVLHYHWTFSSNRSHRSAFPRFLLMGITGFALNWSIMYVGTVELNFNYLLVATLES